MTIQTVLGPIEAEALGVTSMHEHVFVDATVWLTPPREPYPEDPMVTMENLGFVRWNLLSLRDNLIIDDPEIAVAELNRFVAIGGAGLVDLTSEGFGRRVEQLVEISKRTGLHIMAATGFYVHDAHPAFVDTSTVDELAFGLIRELTIGVGDTGIKSALIGEIGTGSPITSREEKVLHAAGIAAQRTGAAVNVHLDARGEHALDILALLKEHGVAPDRVIFSHMDERLDLGYHRSVLEAGAVVEYDTFGEEFYLGIFKAPSDLERFEHLAVLVNEGWASNLLIACDVWTKAQLRHYGGMGYEHLLRRVVPSLKSEYGFSDDVIQQLLVYNPRRLLDRPSPDLSD